MPGVFKNIFSNVRDLTNQNNPSPFQKLKGAAQGIGKGGLLGQRGNTNDKLDEILEIVSSSTPETNPQQIKSEVTAPINPNDAANPQSNPASNGTGAPSTPNFTDEERMNKIADPNTNTQNSLFTPPNQ